MKLTIAGYPRTSSRFPISSILVGHDKEWTVMDLWV